MEQQSSIKQEEMKASLPVAKATEQTKPIESRETKTPSEVWKSVVGIIEANPDPAKDPDFKQRGESYVRSKQQAEATRQVESFFREQGLTAQNNPDGLRGNYAYACAWLNVAKVMDDEYKQGKPVYKQPSGVQAYHLIAKVFENSFGNKGLNETLEVKGPIDSLVTGLYFESNSKVRADLDARGEGKPSEPSRFDGADAFKTYQAREKKWLSDLATETKTDFAPKADKLLGEINARPVEKLREIQQQYKEANARK